jgi:broad specificity phosphatase PhoE
MPSGDSTYFGPHNLRLPTTGGLLVMRHAARQPIEDIEESYTAGLTAAGREAARAFGAQLSQQWSIGEVVASPAARCIETGEEILRGAVRDILPSLPVRPLLVLHFDQKLSGIAGLKHVFLNDPGFSDLAHRPGAPDYTLLQNTLLAQLPFPTKPGVVNLAITHDVVVTFLKASLLKLPGADPQDFPSFLEGICLVKVNNEVRIC